MAKEKFNRLSIYLIKKEFTNHNDILKPHNPPLKHQPIHNVGDFYYGDSFTFPPAWVKSFFALSLSDNSNIFSASAKGLLLVEIARNSDSRIFAIAFGYGWQFLRPGSYEERFGLKTALSVIDPTHLRKIDKKNMVTVPKDSSEQLSKAGIAADFGINIEQDLIRAITGKSINESKFGKTVTGKDSLSVSVKVNVSSTKEFLSLCYEKYLSDEYKKHFDWIDHISELKDLRAIDELNSVLIDSLQKRCFTKTWMAVPELIDWPNVSGFRYSNSKGELKDDIEVSEFLQSLSPDEIANLSIDHLKGKYAYCIGSHNDEIVNHWNVFNCLYCEAQKGNNTYLLTNGKWYVIETDFALQIHSDYEIIRDAGCPIALPTYFHENENKYNQEAAKLKGYCCMDCNCISHGGSYSKIEVCDMLTNKKQFIHIKRYGGSSVLSHLFSQGLVSGELFLGDVKFREKLYKILPDDFRYFDPKLKPDAKEYEIVYGIISSDSNELELPFFSKVSLRAAKNRLETFGYNVSLVKIPTNGK